MAVPKIWIQSTGERISDKCVEYNRWQPDYALAQNELLVGGLVHTETVGDAGYSAEVVFKFADNRPTSTLDNMDRLIAAAIDDELVIFRDLRGDVWLCEISSQPEVIPRGGRTYERNWLRFTLRRLGGAQQPGGTP